MSSEFSQRVDSIPRSKIREFFDLVMGRSDIISLGVGEPDFMTPWSIREEAILSIEKGHTSYTSNQGLPKLREKISKDLKHRYGYEYCSDSEIIVTNGVSEGIDLVLRALLNPDDEVLLMDPAYVCYAPLVHLVPAHYQVIQTHDTNFVPDPERIRQAITKNTKLIILCYPNNPTGASIPKSVLESIIQIAKEHDIWIISDEIYAEISYEESYHSLPSLSGTDSRVILCKGFSKAYAMTGWRIGYICGPEPLISRALKIHQYSALCAPTISQLAAIKAIESAAKDVENMKVSYQERRDITVKALQDMGFDIQVPEGAFYCFPNISSTGLSGMAFARQLLESEGVAVVPGEAFGEFTDDYIRICYAVEPIKLVDALKKMAQFVSRLTEKKI